MATRYPYFPIYVTDFLGDQRVQAMTTEEVGAYVLLLLMAWQETPRGSLPNDPELLARWARCDGKRDGKMANAWVAISKRVLPCFEVRADGRLYQKRMESICADLEDLSAKRSAAGRLGASKRWTTGTFANGKTVAKGMAKGMANDGIQSQSQRDTLPSDEGRESSAFLAAWNSTPHVRPAKALAGGRLRHFRARWADPAWRAQYPAALAAVEHSAFLRGENERGWRPTVDWFLKPDTVTRILEGAYADRPNGHAAKPERFGGVREWYQNQRPQGGDDAR